VTFDALKVADITQINRMIEGLIGLVARITFPIREAAQIDRMLKRLGLQ